MFGYYKANNKRGTPIKTLIFNRKHIYILIFCVWTMNYISEPISYSYLSFIEYKYERHFVFKTIYNIFTIKH